MTKRCRKTPLLLVGLIIFIAVSLIACAQETSNTAPPALPSVAPSVTPSVAPPPIDNLQDEQPTFSLQEAKVTRVIDGDTIEVAIGGSLYKVRYIGIDTPEIVHPSKPVEYLGKEAAAKNRELVEGKVVYLEKDVSETDRYGRLLRYVWVGETMVNAELVRLGYAQASTYPPDVKYQDLFLKLQAEAREAGRGLWAEPRPSSSQTGSTPGGKYVGSIKSNVYHYPTCECVKQIYPRNLIWFASETEAKNKGYRPCKVCNPP